MTPEERRAATVAMRERAAQAVPEDKRADFWRLLAEADDLIAAGWQRRRDAWALRELPPTAKVAE